MRFLECIGYKNCCKLAIIKKVVNCPKHFLAYIYIWTSHREIKEERKSGNIRGEIRLCPKKKVLVGPLRGCWDLK